VSHLFISLVTYYVSQLTSDSVSVLIKLIRQSLI